MSEQRAREEEVRGDAQCDSRNTEVVAEVDEAVEVAMVAVEGVEESPDAAMGAMATRSSLRSSRFCQDSSARRSAWPSSRCTAGYVVIASYRRLSYPSFVPGACKMLRYHFLSGNPSLFKKFLLGTKPL